MPKAVKTTNVPMFGDPIESHAVSFNNLVNQSRFETVNFLNLSHCICRLEIKICFLGYRD